MSARHDFGGCTYQMPEPPTTAQPTASGQPRPPPSPTMAAGAADERPTDVGAGEPAAETVETLKEKGNAAVRRQDFAEAVLMYSYAIKLSVGSPDAILHSNRSVAFLRLGQLYYANEDAERAIQLRPDWAKAHYRRGEVQKAGGQFDSALLSYARALQLQPTDDCIIEAAKRVAALSTHEAMFEDRLPWAGCGLGIVAGVIIVLADQLYTKTPSITHPFLMVLLVFAVSAIGCGIARLLRYYWRLQRHGRMQPPVDLLDEFKKPGGGGGRAAGSAADGSDEHVELLAARNRYSKAQARQRFRKGKS